MTNMKLSGKFNFALFGIIAMLLAASCKKDKKAVTPDPAPGVQPTVSRADLTKDSIFLYAKEVYLWNDALPSYEAFGPRKFTTAGTELGDYNAELYAISQAKINPLTSQPYEYSSSSSTSAKYSYIFDIANQNPTSSILDLKSSVDLDGNGNDFGFKAGAYGSATSYKIVLQAVYPGSPAQKAGLTRGAAITVINGKAYGSNYSTESSAINSALFSSGSVIISGTKKDGTPFTNLTLNKAVYSSSPILKDTVLVQGAKTVGYLAFARFSSSANAQSVLLAAFNKFSAAGINNLVIDLRYNGGGYVSTAQYLANLIAPSNLTGQVMFAEHYNALMQTGQAKILSHQPFLDANDKVQYSNGKMVTYADLDYTVKTNTEKFEKKGSLEGITNVVFIVSGGTASASELVINSLKPYMNVKLVGTTTYGKPVGFFPIRLENKYDVYYSMFQTRNSAGQGEYFAGFTPDAVDSYDDALHDFGDRNENYIAKAIGYIANGAFAVSSPKSITINSQKISTSSLEINNLNDESEFKGMIENRLKLKQ
ncbi:MAG: hypothetical protein K0S09_154 [Sphingobacteriaceae bacterium]|jgi:C-terminal processing protease CtpA/Prc|nr:hypothetical protein [Sphingobacteriaceae bacterium]